MGELKGQILGVIIVIAIFAIVNVAAQGIFRNTTTYLEQLEVSLQTETEPTLP